MNYVRFAIALAAILTFAGCDEDSPPAAANAAQHQSATALTSDKQFVQAFVDAVNSGDPMRIRALVHASCLARIDDANRDFIDQMLERDVSRRIPAKYDTEVTPIEPGEPLPFEGMVQYSVRPTHNVQINFEESARQQTTILRQAVEEKGVWWLVMPIPSSETMQQIKSSQAETQKIQEQARRLAAELDAEHRAEIIGLVKAGQRIDAMKRCAEVCGVELVVAKHIVDELSTSEQD